MEKELKKVFKFNHTYKVTSNIMDMDITGMFTIKEIEKNIIYVKIDAIKFEFLDVTGNKIEKVSTIDIVSSSHWDFSHRMCMHDVTSFLKIRCENYLNTDKVRIKFVDFNDTQDTSELNAWKTLQP